MSNNSNAPAIDVWYGRQQRFGHCGQPQRWVNVLGRVTEPEQFSALTYRLNSGEQLPLSIGRDERRLAARGDFNIDLDIRDLQLGSNQVEIIAERKDGTQNVESVELDYATEPCPLPLTIDWSQVQEIQDVAHVVDGQWSLVDGGISPGEIGYDRLIAIGDMSWRDYEVTVPITIHGISAVCYEYPSVHAGVGIVMRWKGHANWGRDQWASGQPKFGPSPYGAIGWYCVFHDAGPILNFFDPDFQRPVEKAQKLTLHVPYLFKVRVETLPEDASQYSLKVWPQDEAEPNEWDLTTVIEHTGYKEGAILLGAHHTAATFGNVTVKALSTKVQNANHE